MAQKLFPKVPAYGVVMSRTWLILVAILLAVVAGVAFWLLSPNAPEPAREVVMTGSRFAQETNLYKVDPPQEGPFEGYYEYPSLMPGDILLVRDRLTAIAYNNRTRATRVVLSGFEAAPALQDGLFFAGNLTKKYKVGDMVELRFHVIQWVMNSNGSSLTGERLDELNGKAREKSPDGIPASAIRKYS